jgi:hypothetical protein
MEIPIPFRIFKYYSELLDSISPETLMIMGAVVAVLGLAYCLAGFRLFKVSMALLGLVCGGTVAWYFSVGLSPQARIGVVLLMALVVGALGWFLHWVEAFLLGVGVCMLAALIARTSLVVGLAAGALGGFFCLIWRRKGLIFFTAIIGGALSAWGGTIFFKSLETHKAAYNYAIKSVTMPSHTPDLAIWIGAALAALGMLIQLVTTKKSDFVYAHKGRRARAAARRREAIRRKPAEAYDGYDDGYEDDYYGEDDYYEELEVPELPPAPPESSAPRRPAPARRDKGRAAGANPPPSSPPPQPAPRARPAPSKGKGRVAALNRGAKRKGRDII